MAQSGSARLPPAFSPAKLLNCNRLARLPPSEFRSLLHRPCPPRENLKTLERVLLSLPIAA